MILGQIVETIGGQTLDRFCRTRIFGPLGLRALSFIDLTLVRGGRLARSDLIAPTELPVASGASSAGGRGRERLRDGRSRGTRRALRHGARRRCARGALENGLYEEGGLLSRDAIRRYGPATAPCRRLDAHALEYALGRRLERGNADVSRTVGHLGFTGTSMRMDLERRIRIRTAEQTESHPDRENPRIRSSGP
jgi:CubicO group peptidase (beta-lactamase class C family)